MQHSKLESNALKLSIMSALLMAALGIGFALITHSSAILLDGVFSLIFFVMAIFTLYVSRLINRPANHQFPFGYTSFEPLLNLTKGLLQGTVLLTAIVSAVDTLLSGGKEINNQIALYYSVIVTVYCMIFALYLKRTANKTQSEIIKVDANAWFIDCMLSFAVMLGFIVSLLIKDGPYHNLLPYIDPIIVLVLGAISIPVPILIITKYWKQITGKSIEASLTKDIKEKVLSEISNVGIKQVIRAVQTGRTTYIQIYFIVARNNKEFGSLEVQDKQRDKIFEVLRSSYQNINIDLVFTKNEVWADRAVNTNLN